MDQHRSSHSERVLLLTPIGRDAQVAAKLLSEAGVSSAGCESVAALVAEVEAGAGVAVVAEEALRNADLRPIVTWLANQPAWSDFPFILLTHHGAGPDHNPGTARLAALLGNVSFLERPFHPTTFISVIDTALRGRRRQYEARARVEELRATQAELGRLNELLAQRIAARTEELVASERRFRAIFDSAFQSTLLVDLDGRIVFANRTWLDSAGAQLGEVVGCALWDSPWWSDSPGERDRLMREFPRSAGGVFVRYEAELTVPGGDLRRFDFSLKPVLDDGGMVTQVVAEARDITEMKRIEATLHQSQKLETIGQLTGGIAHDFNNLLMVILGSLRLLERRIPDDPRLSRLIAGALQGAERGAALTQRLLAFARRQDLKPQPVDVMQLIEGMSELLRRSVGPMINITVTAPQRPQPVMVDPNQLELAILNLAVNARDAMPSGGTLTIAVDEVRSALPGGLAEGAYARITVIDTGTGMDELTLRRSIEPFFSTKGVGKGTGLGLSMIHGLAVQSGGGFYLKSTLGEGTTAELFLPLAVETITVVPDVQPQAHSAQPAVILVVDDDPLITMSTVDMLEDLGHTVIEAHSATKALSIVEQGAAIDLLVTDHAMPGMTGMELARVLRKRRPDLPILLATGYAELPQDENDIDIPRLSKPYQQHQLASHVAKLLQLRPDPQVRSA